MLTITSKMQVLSLSLSCVKRLITHFTTGLSTPFLHLVAQKRAAIVLSGSPLFNGGEGSGESEIRRWRLENNLVEAIVALPTDIFFRTNIATYLWILSNKKPYVFYFYWEQVSLIRGPVGCTGGAAGYWYVNGSVPILFEGNVQKIETLRGRWHSGEEHLKICSAEECIVLVVVCGVWQCLFRLYLGLNAGLI